MYKGTFIKMMFTHGLPVRQRPASGTRNEKKTDPTRLKPEIGSGSGLKTKFFSEKF